MRTAWATNLVTDSTSANVLLSYGWRNSYNWLITKNNQLALSISEAADYMVLGSATQEVLWLQLVTYMSTLLGIHGFLETIEELLP